MLTLTIITIAKAIYKRYPLLSTAIKMSRKGTTIHLSSETKQELDKLKVHPRQPYEEIIKKLLEEYKKVKANVS
jgi:hypothetical protein